MNKRTTDSYFPFFGVPSHLILHGIFQGSEIRAWKFGWWWRAGEVFFGPRIFLVSSGIREVCDGKTTWEKNKLRLLIQWHTYNM